MVRHVILWKINEDADKEKVKSDAKRELEALKDVIDGIVKMEVRVSPLPSSSCDMMLDSVFENEGALAAYRVAPAHVAAADKYIRPYAKVRLCFDEDF